MFSLHFFISCNFSEGFIRIKQWKKGNFLLAEGMKNSFQDLIYMTGNLSDQSLTGQSPKDVYNFIE